jgi:hypothetical protein
MPVTTSQQISKYYELFSAIDVTFTKEVMRATGLLPQQVYLKCVGEHWPCVIYSTSFVGAKIVVNAKGGFFDKLSRANNIVSLRFSFKTPDKADPLTFFVSAKVAGFSPYPGNQDMQYLTLSFPQRPSEHLIEILGRLLEANVNSSKRREDRILLTPDSMRRLGVATKETVLFVQSVPRRCILRDLSFSGAKVIIVGVAKFLVEKDALLRLFFEDPREVLDIKGRVVRFEDVEGRKDLAALALNFEDSGIPMSYKMRLNDYFTQLRKGSLAEDDSPQA